MHRKSYLLLFLSLVMIVALLSGCAGMQAKPSEANFQAPVVALKPRWRCLIMLATGTFQTRCEVTKGKQDNYGAPMDDGLYF